MKKLPRKFLFPVMISIMLPTMLLGLPAIMTYRRLPEGASFVEHWLTAVGQTVPLALLLAITVGSISRFLVTRFLLEPADRESSSV